jgi:A/G-specific adenine glycosylase
VKSLRPSQRVLDWWDTHRRVLPWRAAAGKASDPYIVWLSEILLQQTTVQTATPYFEKFLRIWPRFEDLAAASLEDVMGAFSGLGYYSRARNLHACAREIAQRGGLFPRTERELRALPGIGAYTAAAIAAIAFNEAATPVDGNIARIVARLIALEEPIAPARRRTAEAAAALTPDDRPGDYAQALMDLGSMICTTRRPSCPICPLRAECAATQTRDPSAYPRKAPRKPRFIRRGAVFFAQRPDEAVLVRTRAPKGLLSSTIELPGTEWSIEVDAREITKAAPFRANWQLLPGIVEQAFTHFLLQLKVYTAPPVDPTGVRCDCYWLERDHIEGAGFSSIMRKALTHAKVLNTLSFDGQESPRAR